VSSRGAIEIFRDSAVAGWHWSCLGAAAMERTLFIDEAAALLGVSRRTVYYRIEQGRLQTIRTRCGTRRVYLSSIEALMREEAAKRQARRDARSRRGRASELQSQAVAPA
jgi:excisionase family DNA binding protein